MTGRTPIGTAPHLGQVAFDHTAAFDRDLSPVQGRSLGILSLVGNVLVAAFYAVFLYAALGSWNRTGSPVGAGLIVFNTMLVVCLLMRHRPTAVSGSVRNWIIAPLSQILPLLLRPAGPSDWWLAVGSGVGQGLGLAVMITSLLALNRSIGIVAANRGIKTRGPYAWVRHPLYSGEILFLVSFLFSNWSARNALLICLIILAQLVRSYQEEALLLRDERYADYRAAVPYRLIPGVF